MCVKKKKKKRHPHGKSNRPQMNEMQIHVGQIIKRSHRKTLIYDGIVQITDMADLFGIKNTDNWCNYYKSQGGPG